MSHQSRLWVGLGAFLTVALLSVLTVHGQSAGGRSANAAKAGAAGITEDQAEQIISDKLGPREKGSILEYRHHEIKDNRDYLVFREFFVDDTARKMQRIIVGWYYVDAVTGEAFEQNADDRLVPIKPRKGK